MSACSAAREYQGTRPPNCNGGFPCDACAAKWAEVQSRTLEQFAGKAVSAAGACKVCDLFARLPELREEADRGRARMPPISYDNIAGYVALKYGARMSAETYRRHYGGHR
jgi:hypothetical protein